jgi:hypothetical protein
MSTRVTDRLLDARRRRFVGRSDERETFRAAVSSAELPFQVLYVFGPGGVGKTTLLREYAAMSEQVPVSAWYLDGRNIEASPTALVRALESAVGVNSPQSLFETLAARAPRQVILLDTLEMLTSLEAWLRDEFLPELPQNTLVVLAGRNPPEPAWRSDPGWQSVFRVLPLRNLAPEESRVFLSRHEIPDDQHPAVLDFTHGHPLALSLVADVFAQRSGFRFQPEAAPDVIKTLMEQFAQKVPGPAHRAALEACALVRVTTEALLAQMLAHAESSPFGPDPISAQSVNELFEWLRRLSFVESSSEGIFPHDLARETLATDLRWRNPDWYKVLHHRARAYYMGRIQQTHGLEQQRTLLDLVFLHRENPAIRSMLNWQTGGAVLPDGMRDADVEPLVAMVAKHEGPESAAIAERWLAWQPDGVTVYRNEDLSLVGFMAVVDLHRATAEEIRSDPATRLAWDYIQSHAPVRSGEVAAYYRFWMAHDTHQAVSPVQTLIIMSTVRYQIATPGLAYHFLPCADPEFWAGAFSYANLVRLPETDFEVGGKHYGVYGHDWRVEPPLEWLALLAEREVAAQPNAVSRPTRTMPIVVLSEPEFAAAVRLALRDYTNPEELRKNPLVQSRLVVQKSGAAAPLNERVTTLQALIQQASESLQTSPREAKLYRALHHTYLHPAATQEQAAEVLDLPFSTYRRHLKSGIDRLVETLWHQEIGR